MYIETVELDCYKNTSPIGLSLIDKFLSFDPRLARRFSAKYAGEAIHSFGSYSPCSPLKSLVNLTPCGVTTLGKSSSYVSTDVSTTPMTPRTEPRLGLTISFPATEMEKKILFQI